MSRAFKIEFLNLIMNSYHPIVLACKVLISLLLTLFLSLVYNMFSSSLAALKIFLFIMSFQKFNYDMPYCVFYLSDYLA